MKIVSWNLRNIGNTKLTNTFTQKYLGFGLGNDVADYVAGLVMGSNRWNAVPNLTTNPADIFIVIELKTGGKKKGGAVSGTCIPTMNNLMARLTTMVGQRYPGNPNPPYQYQYVTPQIIGYHEAVGIIFNNASLQFNASAVLRNTQNNNWITPRSVFAAQFTVRANNTSFNVAGLHAPPPGGGGANLKYRPPIDYSNVLHTTTAAAAANTFFMGDFNTDPTYTYTNGANQPVHPFTNLNGFRTFLTPVTLSSVRTNVNNAFNPPANYLSDAYDNIVFNVPALQQATTRQIVVDMIGQSRNMNGMNTPNVSGTNLKLLVNAYNTVSDHMPVVIEF
jgi:hypothetical protein